jgi:hypothetical protein
MTEETRKHTRDAALKWWKDNDGVIDHQFSLVPPRRKKAITPERMEEARQEIERTGWKPNAKTMAKIADQLERFEERITNGRR